MQINPAVLAYLSKKQGMTPTDDPWDDQYDPAKAPAAPPPAVPAPVSPAPLPADPTPPRAQSAGGTAGDILGLTLAGLGDTLSAQTGRPGNAMQNVLAQQAARQQVEREAPMKAIELANAQSEAKDAGIARHEKLASQDPGSDRSRRIQASAKPLLKRAGYTDDEISQMPGDMVGDVLKNATTMTDARERLEAAALARETARQDRKDAEDAKKQMHDLTVGTKEDQQQDKLEQNFKQGIMSIRGDKSVARLEEQRDAAINAFNRINEIQSKGNALNPVDYVDILGQIYKARTGSAPTNEVLESAKQDTIKGKFGRVFTYMTGQQAPATTQDIMNSLKDMTASMGTQADKLHEAYMKPHMLAPSGLKKERADRIMSEQRGLSFREATGYGSDQGAGAPAANAPRGVSGASKIKVSNGRETLLIDAADEADAAKDGYKRMSGSSGAF